MQPFPISIDRYFFTRFCVVSNPDHVPDGTGLVDARVDSSLEIKRPDDGENVYIAEQRVKMDAAGNPSLPYTLDIECIGFFNVDPAIVDDDQKSSLILAIAHSVLYSSIREAILTATSRQVWGPLSIGISTLQPKNEKTDSVKESKASIKQKKRTSKASKVEQ